MEILLAVVTGAFAVAVPATKSVMDQRVAKNSIDALHKVAGDKNLPIVVRREAAGALVRIIGAPSRSGVGWIIVGWLVASLGIYMIVLWIGDLQQWPNIGFGGVLTLVGLQVTRQQRKEDKENRKGYENRIDVVLNDKPGGEFPLDPQLVGELDRASVPRWRRRKG